jgi:hypothetical protein
MAACRNSGSISRSPGRHFEPLCFGDPLGQEDQTVHTCLQCPNAISEVADGTPCRAAFGCPERIGRLGGSRSLAPLPALASTCTPQLTQIVATKQQDKNHADGLRRRQV